MTSQRNTFRMDHPVIITFLILAIIAFMYFAGEVLKPLALAVLLSFALSPLVRFLENRGLPRTPAVIISVVFSLSLLFGISLVVWQQLSTLAEGLDQYTVNIKQHVNEVFHPKEKTTTEKISKAVEEVSETLQEPVDAPKEIPKVEIANRPTFQERLQQTIGPYMEPIAVGAFVLILVLFLLMNREDLSDRIIQLFGHRQVSLTTRTMEEVGTRISRYLATLTLVNSSFGLIVGLGLWTIGVPLAVLWGFLAAVLRFVPYVGPATAFTLPFVFSIANSSHSWHQPLLVIALFGVIEVAANSFLEPVIYGKTTGVSALGLLVAAMFWTWLWGALGLLLSTPLTVSLAVLGKYVPSLSAFATLLGEKSELAPDLRYYHRLIAMEPDAATDQIDEALTQQPRAEVFDEILLPALSRAERDYARGRPTSVSGSSSGASPLKSSTIWKDAPI